MKSKEHITGIILAGGKSSRMGTDKGLIVWKGKTFTEHVMDALSKMAQEIIIISNSEAYRPFGVAVYADRVKDSGPLAGICSGLHHSKTAGNLIVSCDTPAIHPDLLNKLIEASEGMDVCIFSQGGKWEPLIGFYHKNCLGNFEKALEKGDLKISRAIEGVSHRVLELESEFSAEWITNINSREDLNKLI